MIKTILWVFATALLVPILIFGLYFLNGSLEQVPTDEQHEKARTFASIGLVFFGFLEAAVLLFLLLRRDKKPKKLS